MDLNGKSPTATPATALNGAGIGGTGAALTNSNATAATYGGIVTLNSSSSIGGTGNITLTQGLGSDSVMLTKVGNDTLALNAASTRTGPVSINAGTLQVGASSAMGTATTTVAVTSGAALDLNGVNYSTTSALSINGQVSTSIGALTNSNATAATYGGVVTLATAASIGGNNGNMTLTAGLGVDNVTLTKVGSDTLTLNALSNRTGPVSVNAGILQVGAAQAMGKATSSITVASGAAVDLNGVNYSTTSAMQINGQSSTTVGALSNSSTRRQPMQAS